MTSPEPVSIDSIIPLKWKPVVAAIGAVLAVVGPFILESADLLPQPWPLVVGLVFAALTALGVYQAPYKPKGTVLALNPEESRLSELPSGTPVAVPVETTASIDEVGDYKNPWKD